jgi:hypothetical protein
MSEQIKLSLLKNSHSFFSEGLHNSIEAEMHPMQLKFAIFNMCQAIELSLKERLRREHPILIFDDVDKKNRTVSAQHAIRRLQKICNVPISKKDIETVDILTGWRNDIVHHEFSFGILEGKSALATLIGFITSFHSKHLSEIISDHIDSSLWAEAIKVEGYGNELFSRAVKRFEEESIQKHDIFLCPTCGFSAFVRRDDDILCYVCNTKEDSIECEGCHEVVPVSMTESSYLGFDEDSSISHICRGCIDSAGDLYIQHLIDLERGK